MKQPTSTENWREFYIAAILELEKPKILPRITQAENAILERSRQLFDEDGVNAEEKQALDDAYISYKRFAARCNSTRRPRFIGETTKG